MPKPIIQYKKLFINNEFVNAVSGKTFPTIDPSDEEIICHIAEADMYDRGCNKHSKSDTGQFQC